MINNSDPSQGASDAQRVDYNIRRYFQVFENEIIRRIQESEERIRHEIADTSLAKMDKIVEMLTTAHTRYFDTLELYEQQGEMIKRLTNELQELRYNLTGGMAPAPLVQMRAQSPGLERRSYGSSYKRSPSPKRRRFSRSRSRSPRFKRERTFSPVRHEPVRDCPVRIIIQDPRTDEDALLQQSLSRNKCIYCQYGHFSDECPIVSDAMKRKEILRAENRCFRCCGKLENHVSCMNKECRYCKILGKTRIDHHSSICRVPINRCQKEDAGY